MSLARTLLLCGVAALASCGIFTTKSAGLAVEKETVSIPQQSLPRARDIIRQVSHGHGYEFSENESVNPQVGKIFKLEKGPLMILISNPFHRNEFVVTGYCGVDCRGNSELSDSLSAIVSQLRGMNET